MDDALANALARDDANRDRLTNTATMLFAYGALLDAGIAQTPETSTRGYPFHAAAVEANAAALLDLVGELFGPSPVQLLNRAFIEGVTNYRREGGELVLELAAQALELGGSDPTIRLAVADLRARQPDGPTGWEDALETLEPLVADDLTEREGRIGRGDAYLAAASLRAYEAPRTARVLARRAVAEYDLVLRDVADAGVYAGRARALAILGGVDDARDAIGRAIELAPDSVDLNMVAAGRAESVGDLEAMWTHAREAFELTDEGWNPLVSRVRFVPGLSQDLAGFAHPGDLGMSGASVGSSIMSPSSARPRAADLGVLAARDGDRRAARAAFRSALAARSDYALGWWNLGVLELDGGVGGLRAGQAALARAVELDSSLAGHRADYRTDEAVYRAAFDGLQEVSSGWPVARTYGLAAAVLGGVGLLTALGRLTGTFLGDAWTTAAELLTDPDRGGRRRRRLIARIRLARSRIPARVAQWAPWLGAGLVLAVVTTVTVSIREPVAILAALASVTLATGSAVVVHERAHAVALRRCGGRLLPAQWGPGAVLAVLLLPVQASSGPYIGESASRMRPRSGWSGSTPLGRWPTSRWRRWRSAPTCCARLPSSSSRRR